MSRLSIAVLCLLCLSFAACSDDNQDPMGTPNGGDGDGDGHGDGDGDGDGDGKPHKLDRSRFSDVGVDAPLDYSIPEMWVCRPDIDPNECRKDQTATLIKADGSYEREEHVFAEDPEFDCFYVYPTVLLTGEPQLVDFSDKGVTLVNDALMSQGARFASMCQVYAPFYRQVGLSGGRFVEGADPLLGIQDVRDAFKYYLEHFNKGRKFVLIGHSQGTSVLTALMQQDIDPDDKADVRERLLSALLIGYLVEVPEGQLVGETFKNIPLCSQPGETGCVIAYASFAADNPPGENALFGRTSKQGAQVACVNPATLANNSGNYRASYFRKSIANASFVPDTPLPDDIETPFAVYRDLFKGECVVRDGASYLELSLTTADGDKRTPPWRHAAVEGIGFGLHLVDYQVPMGDLLEAVRLQAEAAL
jgi:pimeloyl-ACP methyl ester carboxylesterase